MTDTLDEVPEPLKAEVERRVCSGAFPTSSAVVAEALRYYFDRHREDAWGEYVREEVAWSRRHAVG